MRRSRLILLISLLAILFGCTSRYRLDLFLKTTDIDSRVKIEETEYVRDAVIVSPYAETKLAPGDANCLILHLTARGERLQGTKYSLLDYDEYYRCRYYVQLPAKPEPGAPILLKNSFIQVLGRFDVPADNKVFLPDTGRIVIDSIAKKRLYGSVNAVYLNKAKEPLTLNGRFKIKIKD